MWTRELRIGEEKSGFPPHLRGKSPDFHCVGGEKVRISEASEEKKSGFPMIILWKKVRNSEPLYRGCTHIFWNSPMRLTIAYSKIKKRNLVLINNVTHQRETLSERPIRQPLTQLF